jgi:hypothetical protein
MRKEVKTYKTVCDFCGGLVDNDDKFTLPMWGDETTYAYKNNHPVAVFNHNVLKKKDVDVCVNCQRKIAYLLTLVNQATLSEDGKSVSFKFE